LFHIEAPPHQEDQVDAPYSTTAKALSDLNKLVACERRGEIESILEKEKSWKTEVSEYVSIPTMVAESIIEMDESADEIDTLLTVLNVLRAHKITTGPRERKIKEAHDLPELVKEMIKFLLARTTEKEYSSHGETFSFQEPSFLAEAQYIELLQYEPCEKVEYNEGIIKSCKESRVERSPRRNYAKQETSSI
jgi:hypothetical protein